MNLTIITSGSSFTETMLYKEHVLIEQALKAGFEVTVIAHTSTYSENGFEILPEGEYRSKKGYHIIRRNYKKYFNKIVTSKIRNLNDFSFLIKKSKPDILFINTPQIYNLKDLMQIKNFFPNIKIYTMFTTTYDNSGKNFISRLFFHRLLYRRWIHNALEIFDGIFYPADIVKDFIINEYKIPLKYLQFLPLSSEIITSGDKEKYKEHIRKEHKINTKTYIFSHSGKMDAKKKTIDLVKIFSYNKSLDAVLFLIGTFKPDINNEIIKLIKSDKRVIHVPFVSGDVLIKYLCATDLYFQPGSVSQTAQTTICCGTPIVAYKHEIYEPLVKGNGVLISKIDMLQNIFDKIKNKEFDFAEMSRKSYEIAATYLDSRQFGRAILGITR